MQSGNSSASDELFSDVDDGGTGPIPLTYTQYRALEQKGAKPPLNGYVLRTSSGESEPEDEEAEADLARKRQIALNLSNRAKSKARTRKTKRRGKGKKKPTTAPSKMSI